MYINNINDYASNSVTVILTIVAVDINTKLQLCTRSCSKVTALSQHAYSKFTVTLHYVITYLLPYLRYIVSRSPLP